MELDAPPAVAAVPHCVVQTSGAVFSTTGLNVWSAGLVLFELALCDVGRALFGEKSVLEVGCGALAPVRSERSVVAVAHVADADSQQAWALAEWRSLASLKRWY